MRYDALEYLAHADGYFGESGVASTPGEGMRCPYLDPKGWTFTGGKASRWPRRLHFLSMLCKNFEYVAHYLSKHFELHLPEVHHQLELYNTNSIFVNHIGW